VLLDKDGPTRGAFRLLPDLEATLKLYDKDGKPIFEAP
jgi:hypothetical protein